jgi:hypothetical protein
MKIHIVNPQQEHVEGFERVEVTNGEVNLSQLADNECSFILATDILNAMSVNQIGNNLQEIRKKMRINSTLVIGGIDIRLLARNIVSGQMKTDEANSFIFSNKSCLDLALAKNLVKSLGLQIEMTRVTGVSYEIEAKRAS